MSTATVTSRGRVTIPAELRLRLGLQAGDVVEFCELGGTIGIRRAEGDVRSLKGLLRKPARPVTVEAMNPAIRSRAG